MGCQAPCAEEEKIGEEQASSPAERHGDAGNDRQRDHADFQLNNTEQSNSQQTPLRRVVYGPDATPDGFTALATEWNQLVQRSRYNTIFLTHEWQTTWWRNLGKGDLWIVAFYATAESATGATNRKTEELVGILPFYCLPHEDGPHAGKRVLTLVGCIEVSDYLDMIIARSWEDAVYDGFLSWLQSDEAPAWDVVDLCNLPEDSLTYRRFAAQSDANGYRTTVSQEDVAPQFVLPAHYETYLQEQVEKKQRHEIRRKQRRAERETVVDFYFVDERHNLEEEVNAFVELQRASRVDKAEFMTPEMRRFFGAVAQTLLDAGYLRLCFLTLNGQKAAVLFAFEYDRKFLLYNSGYDPEDEFAHLSPGWVLLAYSIQYAIAAGCRVFDFMQGDEEYKYRFGSENYSVMRVIVERT